MPAIDAAVGDRDVLVRDKTTYDAFMGTALEPSLREAHAGSVVICGCMTNLCCETTARSAFCRGFNAWFPEDANGTRTREMHERSIENLRYGFATICDTATLIGPDSPVGTKTDGR